MIKFITDISRNPAVYDRTGSEQLEPSLEATGALKVVIQSAHIGSRSWWRRPPRPFVLIQVNNTQAKTDSEAETYDPNWIAQTFFLLVKSPKEELKFGVYDHNTYIRPSFLGAASFSMTRLVESGMALDAQLPLLKQTKQKGDLLCSLCYYPILVTPENENALGIVRLIVHRAEGLFTKAYSHRINALAKIRLRLDWDAPSIHVTRRQKILADGSIVWGSVHEFLCFDKSTCVLYIDVLDPHLEDPVLGHLSICLTDLVEATIAKRGPWPLSGSTTGKLVVSAEWRPLNLAPGL